MTKYSKLMESLRGMEPNVCSCAADAIEDLQVRLAESEDTNKALRVRLGSELERANELLADLQAECSFLLAKRAEREKPKPVAHARKWFIDGEEPKKERKENGRMAWPFKFKLVPVSEGKLLRDDVPLYAAPPVITQHAPVTTVEDRYNADGKSCHITDDLPAGMPLYAAPPVAAPVRLTDEQVTSVVWADTVNARSFVRAVESAVLRANGFKVEE